jgi:hypothetical protein
VDPAGHDFHLQPYSPSIDAGSPALPADPDGSPADQGCYTFIPGPSLLNQVQWQGGTAGFFLNAYTNRNYVLEYSSNATHWNPLQTHLQSSDPMWITDPGATNDLMRLYRARLAP